MKQRFFQRKSSSNDAPDRVTPTTLGTRLFRATGCLSPSVRARLLRATGCLSPSVRARRQFKIVWGRRPVSSPLDPATIMISSHRTSDMLARSDTPGSRQRLFTPTERRILPVPNRRRIPHAPKERRTVATGAVKIAKRSNETRGIFRLAPFPPRRGGGISGHHQKHRSPNRPSPTHSSVAYNRGFTRLRPC